VASLARPGGNITGLSAMAFDLAAKRVQLLKEPDGDSWTAKVVQEGSLDDADRREMVEKIASRLKAEYDLKG
jgi:hypothetical protein